MPRPSFAWAAFREARREAERMLETNPRNEWAIFWLSQSSGALAQDCFSKVASLNPDRRGCMSCWPTTSLHAASLLAPKRNTWPRYKKLPTYPISIWVWHALFAGRGADGGGKGAPTNH